MEDRHLTENFTLFELTHTNRKEFQLKNRELTPAHLERALALARLLEHVRFVLATPITVLSGYRCLELNTAVGSTSRSQHLLFEAADILPGKQELGAAFRALWRDIKDKGTNVGQLIYETTERSYGRASWIHISLGAPYRDVDRCGQILRMENGVYTLLAA